MGTMGFRDVRRSFGAVDSSQDISREVPNRRFAVLPGPSGCSKTKLIRVLAGLDLETTGAVEIDGRTMNDATPAGRGLGMAFRCGALFGDEDPVPIIEVGQ
jgi:ABC-type sugar transport system ATPase subunit